MVDKYIIAVQHMLIVVETVKEKKMNAPMMLPWLAHKWNVSDERALEIWLQACKDAKTAVGDESSSRFWEVAKNRLIDLLDNEVIARYPATETPWIMIQLNVLRFLFWIGVRGHSFTPSIRT